MDEISRESAGRERCAPRELDVVLRDGSTIHLRPLGAADGPGLAELYSRLSADSRRRRFFGAAEGGAPGGAALARIARGEEFALAAELAGRMVAVASYTAPAPGSGTSESTIAVLDSLQGRGIGTRMLECLADIAREEGVSAFEADVPSENTRMLDVFLNSGFEVSRRLEGGVLRVILSIEPTRAYEEKAAERAREAAAASMKAFFEPRSIAVVGASHRRGRIGSEIFHNLLSAGFAGTVYPVNPNAAAVESRQAYPDVSEIPGPVDLAVISVPAAAVEAAVDDCIRKGVRAVVVISAGFAEMGAEGRRREAALLEKVRAAGIRMIGPNCMGILNAAPAVRMNATFSPVYPPAGSVALSTQSGALGLAILDYARRLNIGISTFVSVGNKADVSGNDLIQYWGEDPNTSVILLYLESFGNPRKFSQIARRVGLRKPIAAVKSGRSAAGSRAASSHTGALAQSDAVVDALFRQAGVIRTDTLEELFDVAALLAHQPVPPGRRVGILTNAGGPGILAADACSARGLELPALSDATVSGLRAFLPAAASVGNPVDMLASASPENYGRALRLLQDDDRIDSLLVIFIPPLVTAPEEVARVIAEAASRETGKPLLATFMSAQGVPESLARIPCFPFPESAAAALARVTAYGRWRRRPPSEEPVFSDIDAGEVRGIVETGLRSGGGWLPPDATQRLLAAAGIPVAPARLTQGREEALAAARAIGFPVALKATGPALVHKTEVGGVKLGLADEAAVGEAYDDLHRRLSGELGGIYVQKMIGGGVEVLVGATDDPAFGPVIAYGSGGVLVELLSDVAFRLHPLSEEDVAEMLDEVKGTALLRGYRGSPRVDESALREILLRLSALVGMAPEIRELELNPVKVLEKGAVALDFRIRVEGRRPPPPSRRIVY